VLRASRRSDAKKKNRTPFGKRVASGAGLGVQRMPLMTILLGFTACLPPPQDAGQASPEGSDSASSAATTEAGTDAETDAPGSTTPGGETSTTSEPDSTTAAEIDDACLAFAPEDCPVGDCTLVTGYRQAESTCELSLGDPIPLCVTAGEPLDLGEPTTFYAEIDGEVRYLVHAQPCVDEIAVVPASFTECTGAPGEPEPCQCLCGAQGCPYEAEILALEACALEQPCGELQVNDTDSASTYDLCVLAALRDRIPGAYGSSRVSQVIDDSRVFFGGGEEARLVHRAGDDLCFSVLEGAWDPAQVCTLKPPAWFDECIDDPALHPTCFLGESWFESCEEQPPSCP
jgi:hypothetical protein